MSDMLLSIIIPAYNAERFLPDLLSDLVMQASECKQDSIEIIIVNDGSQDSTKAIAEDFAQKYDCITVINQENKGECGARNTGIAAAKGLFLYFLDSDDAIPAGTLVFFQTLLVEKSSVDIFCFGYEVKRNGNICKVAFARQLDKCLLDSHTIKKNVLSKKLPYCICSLLYRKDFIDDIGLSFPQGIRIGGDVVFMIQAFTKAQTLYYESRIAFTYQIRDDSVMQGYKGYNTDRVKSFEVVRDEVLRNAQYYTSVKKEANFFIANLYLANLVAYCKSSVKNANINDIFIRNKFFLYKSIRGRCINTVAILLARCIPLRLIFRLFK